MFRIIKGDRLSVQNNQLPIYTCKRYFLVVIWNSIKTIVMKCILSCCFCIIACMHAAAQTDSTSQKDTIPAILLQRSTAKNIPAFSYRMLISSRLPDSSNSFYILPNYGAMRDPAYMNNKWQTTWQLAGYTLLSIVADNNHYIYNYTPPKR